MGIHTDFTEVEDGFTRINVKLKSDEETEINGRGPQIEPADFESFLQKIRTIQKGDILILSGSIPSCMAGDTYEQIIQNLDSGVRVVADAEKDLLLKILKYRPFLIKPNNIELGDMFDTVLKTDDEIIACARRLREQGAVNVLVSRAKDGALLVDENDQVHTIGVAKGTVVNSVGAGDSMVAGFLGGYLKTGDYAYALKLGTACGGATAFHSGLATSEQIEEVLKSLH